MSRENNKKLGLDEIIDRIGKDLISRGVDTNYSYYTFSDGTRVNIMPADPVNSENNTNIIGETAPDTTNSSTSTEPK